MIKDSKILTVSYGTFSCTLEGFDDSFTTMKAIAEYFRDLAADDRYFGAEPPTPDAEMLARIAEREIERRVQAHEDGGKIVLRASEETPAALPHEDAADTPSAQAEDAADDQLVADITDATEEPLNEAAQTPVAEVAEAQPAAISQGLTAPMPLREVAKVEEIEEAVVEEIAETPEAPAQPEDTSEAVMAEVETASEVETAVEPVDIAKEDEADTLADFAEDESVAPQIETADVSHPDPDSVAAKLGRIRSVVAQSEQPYGDTDYSEDEHASGFLETNLADLDAALAADDAAEMRVEEFEDTVEADAEPAVDTQTAVDVEVEAEIEVEVEVEAQVEAAVETSGETDIASILANVSVLADDTAEADTAQADTSFEVPEAAEAKADPVDTFEDTLAQLMADALPVGGVVEADDAELEDEELPAETPPLNVRVTKMKRADVDAALAAGQVQEVEATNDAGNLFSDESEDDIASTLSAEEEAELQRELAEVEADFAPEDMGEGGERQVETADDEEMSDAADDMAETAFTADEDEMEEALDDASTASARGVDRLQAVEQTSDVSRIFEEADTQLDEPESSERRNAIQHLRAAVAATRADQNAGVDISKDKDDSAYRSDLADVVRPRRPRAGGTTRSERPGTERPAPLKLVAEQRIDTPQAPVRPRRITTKDLADITAAQASPDADGGFADFAEEMGAGALPELLEAAAAYMADVEGRPQFSRPMLMGKLKEVEGDAFSREDGLRSFGQLLRQGKLQKLKGGRFSVTEETDFRAQARNAG